MEHNLKCWPEYFRAVKTGAKPFEIRKWDRPYAVGDCLVLQEYDPKTSSYTGDSIVRQITYLLDLTYLPGDDRPHHSGYVALGITPPAVKHVTCSRTSGTPPRGSRYNTARTR
jgi:hypothetical protein